jgi:hypothetical protein
VTNAGLVEPVKLPDPEPPQDWKANPLLAFALMDKAEPESYHPDGGDIVPAFDGFTCIVKEY